MVKEIISYSIFYEYENNPGGGYMFECDQHGNVDESKLNPTALESYNRCKRREGVKSGIVEQNITRVRLCSCGSKLERHALIDARNIFVSYVCKKCEERVKKKYRSDIFTNPNYHIDEYEGALDY